MILADCTAAIGWEDDDDDDDEDRYEDDAVDEARSNKPVVNIVS